MKGLRKVMKDYGIYERRAIKFKYNDLDRAQVVCENKCSFYIWCRKKKKSSYDEIRTLVNEHLCTNPYHNKIASVKYLTDLYGERIRKNPTLKVKYLIQIIK